MHRRDDSGDSTVPMYPGVLSEMCREIIFEL